MANEKQRAIRRIELLFEALDSIRRYIQTERDAGRLDPGYANLKLNELESRETDLGAELDMLMGTSAIATAPSDQDLEDLAAAVRDLHDATAASAAAKALVDDAFVLIGIALEG